MFFNFFKNKKPATLADKTVNASYLNLGKAHPGNYLERFREIISDPVNLLISRVPNAGYLDEEDRVILHNGNRVPLRGPFSYYEQFSDILIINRGVHEPLEEYCFQQLIKKLKIDNPVMLELGAYWGHYSMWLNRIKSHSTCYLVEPDAQNLESGRKNFEINKLKGNFIQGLVDKNHFEIDLFLEKNLLEKIDIVHADIQGAELIMLECASAALQSPKIDYFFISTHSDILHQKVKKELLSFNYRIETDTNFSEQTTSYDGFIFASSSRVAPIFHQWSPLGRLEITKASPKQLIKSISSEINS